MEKKQLYNNGKPFYPYTELSEVSSEDNGKILKVINGEWALVTPVSVYSGSSSPNNSQGNNGDLYMQI